MARPRPALPPSCSVVLLADPRPIDLVEALEDARLVRVRNADAVVGDAEPHALVDRLPADRDLAAMMAVLHRVVREVEEGLTQAGGVRDHPNRRVAGGPAHEPDLASLGNRPDPFEQRRHDVLRIEHLQREVRRARLDGGQVEQLVDELGEVIGLALDLRGEVAHRGGVVDRARRECLGKQLDRGQRRAQLVPDVGDEVAAHALDTPQRGDIVQRQHQATANRHGINGKAPGTEMAEVRLAAGHLAARDRLAGDRVQRRRPEGRDQAHPAHLVRIALGEPSSLDAGLGDAQEVVNEDDEVVAAACEQRGERLGLGRIGHAGRGEKA